jgi:hypothetical protein
MALISQWRFENGATDSVGANNGTATNVTYSTSFYREGGMSGSFNGSSSSVTVDGLDPYDNASYSFMLWFKSSAISDTQSLLELAQSDTNNNRWAVRFSSGTILFYLNKDGTGYQENGTHIVQDGKWHHIAYVDASGVYNFYVDGEADMDGTFTRFVDDNQRFTFGKLRFNAFSDYFLNGYLDDLRYYNEALTGASIAKFYAQNCQQYGVVHP